MKGHFGVEKTHPWLFLETSERNISLLFIWSWLGVTLVTVAQLMNDNLRLVT